LAVGCLLAVGWLADVAVNTLLFCWLIFVLTLAVASLLAVAVGRLAVICLAVGLAVSCCLLLLAGVGCLLSFMLAVSC
jgi:hypothetical protein